LALQLKEGEEEISAKVVVRNGSGRPLGLEFSAVLRDSTGELLERQISVRTEKPITANAYSVTPVDLEMDASQFEGSSLPLKGFLVVSGTKTDGSGKPAAEIAPGTLPVTVSKADPRPNILSKVSDVPLIGPMDSRNLVLLIPFGASLIVVGFACGLFYITKSDDEKPAERWRYAPLVGKRSGLGTGLAFSPGASWATWAAAVATLTNTFVAAQIFPATRATFTHKEVLVLSFSFAVLLLAAPAIYNGLRWSEPNIPKKRSQDDKETGQPQAPQLGKELELKGYALTLLASSAGILGALLGQLLLLIFLVNEVENVDMPPTIRWLLWLLIGLVMVYSAVYVIRGVLSSLREEVRWGKELEKRKNSLETQRHTELLEWRLTRKALRQRRTELRRKVPRTAKEKEELREIRKKLRAIPGVFKNIEEEQAEIAKALEFGTDQRRMSLL
jgi:MFS family permease